MKKEFIPLPSATDPNIWGKETRLGSPKKALAAGYVQHNGVWGWWKETPIPKRVQEAYKTIQEAEQIKKQNQENWNKYGNSLKNKDFAYTQYANALQTVSDWEATNGS